MDSFGPDDPPPATPARPSRPWCLFRCGQAGYAIGLESVAEVVEVERLVRLPHSPPRVLGLCSLRREVIPIIGLNGTGPDPVAPQSYPQAGLLVLILRTARGPWAVRINAEGTIVADEGLDDFATTDGPTGPTFLGTVRRGDEAYAVIDPEATWRDVRRTVEDWYCDRMGREAAAKVSPDPGRGRLTADREERATR